MAADVGASMESRYIRWVLSSLEYSEFVASKADYRSMTL